jgi:type IV pilus assembly protein PilW
MAEGVEDLQLAYACDGCAGVADGVVDDQNASATFDTGDFVSDNAWNSGTMIPSNIRLVRISIVARQVRPDAQWSSTVPVVAEDHNPGTDPGFDQHAYKQVRRRLYTKTVQVRNLGL